MFEADDEFLNWMDVTIRLSQFATLSHGCE